MSNYIFLNIQVLPKNSSFNEIGRAGYFKLFRKLNENRIQTITRRNLHLDSYKLHDTLFINFLNIHFSKRGIVFGNLIKFDQPEAIYDTYSGEKLQDIPIGASSRREEYQFVFNLENHIAAIHCPSTISPSKLRSTFRHFLHNLVSNIYSNHILTVDIISNNHSIEEVFIDAEYFKSLKAEISYSNQTPFERILLEKDQELRNKGITKRIVVESANEAGGEISEPTEDMMVNLTLAKRLGDAEIRYKSSNKNRFVSFIYSLNPFKKQLRRKPKESEDQYRERIVESINEAANQANIEIRKRN